MKLTKEAIEVFRTELAEIISIKLANAQKELKLAVDDGDGEHDNTHWQRANENFQKLLNRKQKLEKIIREAKIIKNKSSEVVKIGAIVELKSDKKLKKIQIVESIEANPRLNKISVESPIAKLLMNKRQGESIEIKSVNRITSYLINKIF